MWSRSDTRGTATTTTTACTTPIPATRVGISHTNGGGTLCLLSCNLGKRKGPGLYAHFLDNLCKCLRIDAGLAQVHEHTQGGPVKPGVQQLTQLVQS